MATEIPKRSGKPFLAGREGPEDDGGDVTIQDDFEQPNVVAGTPAAEDLTLQEADQPPAEEQQDLPMDMPEVPKVVRNGKMLAEFVRPHFEKEEAGDRWVGFEFAFPLTIEHEKPENEGCLPTEVFEEWQHIKLGNVTLIKVTSVESQTLAVGLVPDDSEHDLILTNAVITHPVLQIVEEKGKGKGKKVVRFSFRAVVPQIEGIARFAVDHHGDPVWINLQRAQETLFEK